MYPKTLEWFQDICTARCLSNSLCSYPVHVHFSLRRFASSAVVFLWTRSHSSVERPTSYTRHIAPSFYFISRKSAIKITQNLIRFTSKLIWLSCRVKIRAVIDGISAKIKMLKIPSLYIHSWIKKSFLVLCWREKKRKIIKSLLICFPDWLAIKKIRKTIHKLLTVEARKNFPERSAWRKSE